MSERYCDDPITIAVDAQGNLHHVDTVPNGLACGCFCPAPGCHAQLIAKNGGRVLVHHFAHKAGSNCEWALESVLTALIKQAIQRMHMLQLPGWYVTGTASCSPFVSSVSAVREVALEGWGAPALVVSCLMNGRQQDLLYLLAWHDLPEETAHAIVETGLPTVAVALRALYSNWKDSCERHSNSAQFMIDLQTEETAELIVAHGCAGEQWLVNEDYQEALAARQKEQETQQKEREAAWEAQRRKMQEREQAKEQRRIREQKTREERQAAIEQAKEQRRAESLAAMEDFCLCNGLTLRKVRGAGALVDCPLAHRKVGVHQSSCGCCDCDAFVKDFSTHIACAVEDDA